MQGEKAEISLYRRNQPYVWQITKGKLISLDRIAKSITIQAEDSTVSSHLLSSWYIKTILTEKGKGVLGARLHCFYREDEVSQAQGYRDLLAFAERNGLVEWTSGKDYTEVTSPRKGPRRIEITGTYHLSSQKKTYLLLGISCKAPAFNSQEPLKHSIECRQISPELLEGSDGTRYITSENFTIHKIEIFKGNAATTLSTYHTTLEQAKAWERIANFFSSFSYAEEVIVKNWDYDKAAVEAKKGYSAEEEGGAEYEVLANNGGYSRYSGYGGSYYSSTYNYSNHCAEWRVAGDDTGRKIVESRKEIDAKIDAKVEVEKKKEQAVPPEAVKRSGPVLPAIYEDPDMSNICLANLARTKTPTIH